MLAGFCGTLMTPMAANFNLVPAALLELNRAYHARFGFPFVLAVKGKNKNDIRAALEARVGNDLETEFETALGEIEKIARFRLAVLISS